MEQKTLNKRDTFFMKEALRLAKLAYQMGEIPIGAVVVKGSEIVGSGYNRTHQDKDALAHAEVIAIRNATDSLGLWRLDGCSIYVTIEPCPMCTGAILESRLSRLVYGAGNPKTGTCGSLYHLLEDKRFPFSLPTTDRGVLRKECLDLVQSYFYEKRREKGYSRHGEMAERSKAVDSKSTRR